MREREREIKGFLFVRRKSEVTRHVTVLLPAFATVLLNSERRRLAFSIQKQAGDRAKLRRRRSEFSVERKETGLSHPFSVPPVEKKKMTCASGRRTRRKILLSGLCERGVRRQSLLAWTGRGVRVRET